MALFSIFSGNKLHIYEEQYKHFYVCMHHGPAWKHEFTLEWC